MIDAGGALDRLNASRSHMTLSKQIKRPTLTEASVQCRRMLGIPAMIATLAIAGCATGPQTPLYGWNWKGPAPDGFYVVRNGDSLSEVAEKHDVSLRSIARWNRLTPPYTIYADTLLRVAAPDGRAPRRVPHQAPATVEVAADAESKRAGSVASRATIDVAPRPASDIAWRWPLHGPVIQGFRPGDRTRQGLRIGGRPGDPVRAAADGVVVYSGSGLKGYGNLIIVKHNDKYLSAYGFNRRLLSSEGSAVRAGEAIAEVGQGAEGTYLLHFEVRREGSAVDPLLYLPARK